MSTMIAFLFGAGLALSAISGLVIFASAALHLVRAVMTASIDSLERALVRSATLDEEIGRPRAHWRTS